MIEKGAVFMPATYGYAMTVRRAQGTTLDMAALHFDRRRPDRGYGYVGSSRVKRKADLYHVGSVRRSDWLPVGGDTRGPEAEQTHPSHLSDSYSDDASSPTSSDEESSSPSGPSESHAHDGSLSEAASVESFSPGAVFAEPEAAFGEPADASALAFLE